MKLVRTPEPHPALIFVAPALDVVLILVFFLLLSTSFLLQPGVSVAVPDSPFLLAPQRDPQVVSVTAAPTSTVYFENRQVSFELLRRKLESQPGRKRTLIIKADRLAPFDLIAHVMAVSLELGYPTVLATSEHPQ
ncbi:MAG: biopolymer transporter ExbD [Verrucomicrobiota bacterium]